MPVSIAVCGNCSRAERTCRCGAFSPVVQEVVEVVPSVRETVRITPRPRPRVARAPAPPAAPAVTPDPSPAVEDREAWMKGAVQALSGATPENLAGPHALVNGTWFTYVKRRGWVFTTDT